MTRKNTTPIVTHGHRRLTIVVLTLIVGVSGCTQASRWMSRKDVGHSDAVSTVAVDNEEFASPEFQQVADTQTFEQSKFVPTGFVEVIATAASADSPTEHASALVPPASHAHGQAIAGAGATSSQHHLTKLTTPRKTLITLGAADNLDEKLRNAPGVVLVDFYADWCGPCRRQGTILHDMETQADQNNATIIKVDVDRHRQLAQRYKVTSLPTLIAMKDGNVVKRQVGLASSTKVASLLRL